MIFLGISALFLCAAEHVLRRYIRPTAGNNHRLNSSIRPPELPCILWPWHRTRSAMPSHWSELMSDLTVESQNQTYVRQNIPSLLLMLNNAKSRQQAPPQLFNSPLYRLPPSCGHFTALRVPSIHHEVSATSFLLRNISPRFKYRSLWLLTTLRTHLYRPRQTAWLVRSLAVLRAIASQLRCDPTQNQAYRFWWPFEIPHWLILDFRRPDSVRGATSGGDPTDHRMPFDEPLLAQGSGS